MNKTFAAILLISLGTIFFLTNFGIIPGRFWPQLISFWPLLLVIAGVRIVFGRSSLSNAISLIIILSAIVLSTVLAIKRPMVNQVIKRIQPHSSREIYELNPFSERPYRIHIR